MDQLTEEQPRLSSSVAATCSQLQADYLGRTGYPNQAQARGTLAELRKSAGQPALQSPLVFERVLSSLVQPLSAKELGRGDAPSPSEEAAFHALAFFALHMQGATHEVHDSSRSFATACGQLAHASESKSIKGRFDALVLARTAQSRLIQTRSLISLLRSKGLRFNYGWFAADLRKLSNPRTRNGVLLRWGRDFAFAMYARDADRSSASEEN
ncbi:type I-E CRISPR-associated protein Cse2/CasB [Corynebacterium macclintockiae]|uniref:type I-E CRISPR-associated protein Cse2/CasB n=1 Tax=Corynebacterium macclintockiae TaxID=2913501 RepID=UPI003EBE23A3